MAECPPSRKPEPPVIRPLLAIASLCALTACATTDSARLAELAELKAEARAMRETQARLEKRLELLERQASVSQAARTAPRDAPAPEPLPAPARAAPATSELAVVKPELTVVKLKPRTEPAPALPTHVDVVEPSSEDAEMFISASPDTDGPSAAEESQEPVDAAALDTEFDQAVAALRTGNVEGAVARLLEFARKNPRHSRADNALYFGGLGQMGLKDYATASKTFEQLLSHYPAGDAVMDGMLRLAECHLRLAQTDDARALYTRILTQFPGTAAATQAEQRLASLSH